MTMVRTVAAGVLLGSAWAGTLSLASILVLGLATSIPFRSPVPSTSVAAG